MSVTAKELAKILHISEAAVSMALNNRPGVSTTTRQKVIEAAHKYGYDFTRLWKESNPRIERGSISLIIYKKHGAVVTDTPFFEQLTEGIELECRHSNYILNIHYFYEGNNVSRQLSALPYCNGIILLATEMKSEDFRPFDDLRIPIVVLDAYYENLKYDCVLINNFQGAFLAANYCIQKLKVQPGYLRSAYSIGNFNERADGFYKAIRDNGMSASKSQVFWLTPSWDGAYEDMLALIKSGEELSRCYFADNDLIAAGAIKALKELNYRIPEDVGIIGFDDMPLCTYIEPSLTTINVPKQYMGRTAVKRLVEILESSEHYPTKTEINTKIIKRKSI